MSYPIGSLKDILSWARGRDPSESYDYSNMYSCALAKYFLDRTGSDDYYAERFRDGRTEYLEELAQQGAYTYKERTSLTMGGFVKRLELAIEGAE